MQTEKGKMFTDLVLKVFKLGGMLVAEGDKLTVEFGLTSARWKVLGAIALSKVPLTVPQIARAMGQTRQSVQRIADCMYEKGLLAYEENPAHKRAKLLVLTGKGKEVFESLNSVQTAWADRMAEDLDISELKTTLAVVRQLIRRFEL